MALKRDFKDEFTKDWTQVHDKLRYGGSNVSRYVSPTECCAAQYNNLLSSSPSDYCSYIKEFVQILTQTYCYFPIQNVPTAIARDHKLCLHEQAGLAWNKKLDEAPAS